MFVAAWLAEGIGVFGLRLGYAGPAVVSCVVTVALAVGLGRHRRRPPRTAALALVRPRPRAALGGVVLGLISLACMPETTEHRLVEAGYPGGPAVRAHEVAQRERQEAESVQRRAAAAWRARRYRERNGR